MENIDFLLFSVNVKILTPPVSHISLTKFSFSEPAASAALRNSDLSFYHSQLSPT